ncbi:MAG: acetyl-CoA carboxylase biotin carboxylase subunit [Anaerolineaceae bacterium]|nr:acetyl-CoA carboxylase biotin carboxylase subunit [Anaerolineaceae bacterium]
MKILVANRGEIALRVLGACRELGMPCVAVYSEADRGAPHARYADESVCIGPASASESYLNIEALLAAARQSGAQAIHPGYGFLSENAAFAHAVEQAGITFIGPGPETLKLTGDKLAARQFARQAGLPVLEGPDIPIDAELSASNLAQQIDFPVLIKAVSGGGGRGIRIAYNRTELESMVTAARQEASAAFGDDQVYLEPLVRQARHIEVQILGDGNGNVLILGERECSIQRRMQKLIEEAPAPGLNTALRQRLYRYALQLGQALNYRSLGTVEFLLDPQGELYFIEINPRIQVEHPVTEMVTGIDLVQAQLRLADGQPLTLRQEQVRQHGAAIEVRVLAEDPQQGFLPATGEITYLNYPLGPGVRIDGAISPGMQVNAEYDSLLVKIIVWGEDRIRALARMRRALDEFQLGGVQTDLDFLKRVVESPRFVAGKIDTTYLDSFQPVLPEAALVLEKNAAVATALLLHHTRSDWHKMIDTQNKTFSAWRSAAWREQMSGY